MTELETLQQLVNNDPEFKNLVTELNRETTSYWNDTGDELYGTKENIDEFKFMTPEYFFAYYKTLVSWAAMLNRILKKIHGNIYDDTAHAIYLQDSKVKYYVIYRNPWLTSFRLEKVPGYNRRQLILEEPLSVCFSQDNKHLLLIIKFSLIDVKVNLNGNKPLPNLKDSMMSIEVLSSDGESLNSWTIPVKNFMPELLNNLIDNTDFK